MKDLIEINDNMGRNIEYSIDFFDYSDYELTIDKPTMMEGDDWISFLNTTDRLSVPLKKISTCTKTHKLWFKNSKQFDKVVVELDNSLDNNIIEFIAKKTKYRDIVLSDMKKLGCIVWKDYIDNNGFQQKDRFYVGRPSINTYTDDKLSLTISQLNKIMGGSDFEKNVNDSITGAFHSFISLKDAFVRIYNIPKGTIDRLSYPATPFRLDESNYVPSSTQDIVLTDGNLTDDSYVYAEDTVAGTDRDIHCQFYYKLNSPQCGFKMTEYDSDGDPIGSEEIDVMNWNVWGNTEDALNNTADGYTRQIITQWQRYFRPFRVAIAGDIEFDMFAQSQYRLRRDYVWGQDFDEFGEKRDDFYDPDVNNGKFEQKEIIEGKWVCQPGDRLVYFEVLGDIRYRSSLQQQPSANILYDNYSTVYVYNIDRDIVYFDHVTRFIQTIPLPKQWLDMKNYIATEKIYYSSTLDYENSNNFYFYFLSNIKPMCALSSNDGTSHGLRYSVASTRSLKNNQNSDGQGGTFVGEKMIASMGFGTYDIENTLDRGYLEEFLDNIVDHNKPKSIRLSDDGLKIYYLKNNYSGFDVWNPDWDPEIVPVDDYTKIYEIPKMMRYSFKWLYTTLLTGEPTVSQKEYDGFKYITFGDEDQFPLVTEITDRLNDDSVVLMDHPIYSSLGVYAGGIVNVVKVSNSFTEGSRLEIADGIPIRAINLLYNNGVYWSLDNNIYNSLTIFKSYSVDWNVLDYNDFIYKAIIQTPTELIYYDTLNDVELYDKTITGFDYLYSMRRDNFIFTNPVDFENDQLIRIGSTINEPVRLLSFDDNRYKAGDRLACSFIKNSYYDGDGVLNIGFSGDKFELTDYSVISNSVKKYKYDTIEYNTQSIKKNGFTQVENDNATTAEEEELEYDESISITMWSNKDVQMDFTVDRTSSTEITWTAVSGNSVRETGTVTIVGFDFFKIDLTGAFVGITITCDFYNTELGQGEKFRGTIDRKEYTDNVNVEEIIDVSEDFPFLDDQVLGMEFPFLYELYGDEFYELMNNYFTDEDDFIREFVEFTIDVPTLLFFDTSYKPFKIGSIITLTSDSKYVNGYSLDDGIITPYNENKCDYYIESMVYDMSKGTTKLNLISV